MAQPASGIQYSNEVRNFILGYLNRMFTGRYLFPRIPVIGTKGEYRMINPTRYIQEDIGPLADDGSINRIDQESQLITYIMDRYGLSSMVPDASVRRNGGNSGDLEMEASMDLASRFTMGKEQQAATLVEDDGNFGTSTTVSTKWNDDTGDPTGEILDAKEEIRKEVGAYPNYLQMSATAWSKVRRGAKTVALLGDNISGYVSRVTFANFIEIPPANFIIAGAIKNEEPEGVAANNVDIWGDDAVLWLNTGSMRYQPKWAGCLEPRRNAMRSWRDRDNSVPGLEIFTEGWWLMRVFMKECGYKFKDITS